MMNQTSALPFILLCSFLAINSTPVTAQITPDNTLGAESSRVVPNGAIDKIIDGGALRDKNLFHSFKEFNINNSQSVYFSNPSGIENILTRVTGGNASNILGTLGVNGAANLFLINPNGILFGENARLDLQGSFVGTTASGLQFGEQGTFSATNPEAPGLLTVNPNAFFFNQIKANAAIINQSQAPAGINPNGDETTGLRVPDGKSFLIVGGDINFDGGRLRAYEGNIELASVTSPGSIGLDISGNNFRLNVPEDVERGDISLANESYISVFGAGGGNLVINARNLEISNSFIFAGIAENSDNPDAQAGDININATDSILLKDGADIDNGVYSQGNTGDIFLKASNSISLIDSLISNNIEAGGVGKSGNININSGSLSVTDGSQIQAFLRDTDVEKNLSGGQGNAGNININVRDAVTIAGIKDGFSSDISSFVGIGAVGNAGDININTGSLSLVEGSEINAKTSGQGNAGNITVNARQSISLDGSGDVSLNDGSNGTIPTRIISSVNPEAVGNSGNIQLNTGTFSATNGALISNSISGKGDAGNITINARDTVTFDIRSSAESSIFSSAVGKGGDIRVTSGTLSLTNGGKLSTNVFGEGNGGNIFVEARDSVKLDGIVSPSISGIQSDLITTGVGKGGDIQITTGLLSVTNGAAISANTSGQGDAGNITINASDKVNFDGFDTNTGFPSQVSTTAVSNSIGNGGDIAITTGELLFKNSGSILTINFGEGNAGNIFLDVGDTITFDGVGSSKFSLPSSASSAVSNGNGGNIEVKTGSLFLTNGGLMNAGAWSDENSNEIANGGSIIINARDHIKFDGKDSSLSTNLSRGAGKGGDIQVTTGSLSITNNAVLSATTSGPGDAGNININSRDTVTFDRGSFASTSVLSNAIGNGGDIQITTGSLFLDNASILQSSTSGQGDAGNININARDTVTFNRRSFAATSASSNAIGDGGDIQITTGSLFLDNASILQSSTFAQGNAGNININARHTITFDRGSFAATSASSNAIGDGGDIEITTGSLFLDNGGFFSTGTSGKGDAGKVKVDAADSIALSNSSYITSNVFTAGEGKGGAIDIDTQTLTLTGSSQIAASSNGTGDAGDIDLQAGTLQLDNGFINAQTATTKGGNINLQLRELLQLRNNSQISTSAGTAQSGGDGGNITINSPFIVAVPKENSDIKANAFTGRGGNIDIKSQGIFGIKPRSQASDFTSDITASSETGIQGEISVTDSDIDPSQGLIELPNGVVDKSNEIAQNCPRGINAKKMSEFYITGRGSLPPSPLNPLEGTVQLSRLATLDGEIGRLADEEAGKLEDVKSKEIVEAQGFLKTENGEIYLVAQAPTATPSSHANTSVCPSYQ